MNTEQETKFEPSFMKIPIFDGSEKIWYQA